MKTYLAYIIVIVVSQFCLTAGFVAAWIIALLLAWLPTKVRTPLCAFLGGVAGSYLAVLVAFLVFRWIAGPDSFGWGPFLAATVPLSIPIYNDYRKSVALEIHQDEISEPRVAVHMAPDTAGAKTAVYGEIASIVVAGVLFL